MNNSFKGYQTVNSYWYDKVPSHWKKTKNKYVLNQIKNVVGDDWKRLTLLTLGKSGVKPRDMDGGGKFPESFENYQKVEPNQLIFCLFDLDETPRTIGISNDHGMITSAYDVFSTNKSNDPKYWTYFYKMIDDHKGLRPFYTGLRKVVRSETFMSIEVFSPPIEEQKMISNYLDRKIEQIDKLIQKINKKIKILNEQRLSIINKYVTKGSDLNVEMKNSGIEWIGNIPKHWKIKKLKHIGYLKSGDGFKIELQGKSEGDFPFYKVSDTNIKGNEMYLSTSNNYLNSKIIEKNRFHIFPKNTIIFPKIGAVIKLNKRRISQSECCIDNNMMGLILTSREIPEFVYFYMILVNFDLYCSDGTIPSISESQVGQITFVSPPISEQKNIVDILNKKLTLLEKLVFIEKKRVKNLIEYRQSLISSVVTGKVRVTRNMI